jgi:hypothetical protein
MRFLLDQDVYAATARFLRDLGHADALAKAFVVVEPGGHRIRRPVQ